MKLRQKLAVVLASAMVVTAVPVVTMAASTNSLTKETLKVKKDAEFLQVATANAVKIKFTDNSEGSETFYLDLDNAKWDEDVLWEASQIASNHFEAQDASGTKVDKKDNVKKYVYDNITYERQNDDTMKISIEATEFSKPDTIKQIPLFVKAKDGDAKVSIVSKNGTTVSQGTFVFATTAEKKVAVKVASDKSFYTSGKLSDITLDEAYKGSLANGAEFTIELEDSDFYFVSGSFDLEGKYGFSSYGTKNLTGTISGSDKGKLTVKLPAMPDAKTEGTFVLKNLQVKSTNKKPEEGDFLVSIKGDDLVAEKDNVKAAKVSNYSVYAKMKDDKVKDVKAGRTEELEFEVGENVDDSMRTGSDFDMTLENGHWDYKKLVKDFGSKFGDKTVNNKKYNADTGYSDEEYQKWATQIDEYWLAKTILDNDGDWKTADSAPTTDSDKYCKASFDQDNDGQAIVETITFTPGTDDEKKLIQTNGDCDVLKFKTKVCVPIGDKEKEKVTLKVSGRGVDDEATATLINIVNPFNVTFEQAVLKTGKQAQVAGSVTLTETDKDCLQKGELTFKITKDDEDFGIYLTDADVEVSDGLKGTKSKITKGKANSSAKMELTLNRASKAAATITFKNMTFTTDRTVPEGTYDLEISGTAVDGDAGWLEDNDTEDMHKILVKDFIKISTTNTQDITSSGLAKGTAKFVIGEKKYTLNDQPIEMDAPSYIQDPGYTMVSVRFVAQAFGVAPSDILFGKGTVTIFAGERTISLTTGSNVAVVNGNNVNMPTKVVNKDGRTFVPAAQIASLLGIATSWDSATKTATFENK